MTSALHKLTEWGAGEPASSHLPELLASFLAQPILEELPDDLPDLAKVSAVGKVPGPHSPSSRQTEPSSVINAPLLAFAPYPPKSLHLKVPLEVPVRLLHGVQLGIALHEILDRCLLDKAQLELARCLPSRQAFPHRAW